MTVTTRQRLALAPGVRSFIRTCAARVQRTRVHTIRFLGYRLACAAERLLIGLPGETPVLAGRIAEKWDYARCADEDIDGRATEEEHER